MTGQPDRSGQDPSGQGRPGQDQEAAGGAGGRSSGNWREAVDGHDAGPAPDTAPGRDTVPDREAKPGRDTGPGRDAGPPRLPAFDLTGDIQRWLIRSGARSMRRELGEQFRKAWTGQRAEPTDPADVWNTATTEPPPELSEAPECAWCPVCRAARRIRESGPGLGGQLAGAGDAVAAAVQEALSAFDSVLSARPRTEPAGPSTRPATDDRPEASAPGAPSEGPDHEPDDRD